MDALKTRIDADQVAEAVVVGGGFIGLEMAENLVTRGVKVTVVEMLNQLLSPLDFEMAAMLHRHLREKGVRVITGDGLREIAAVGRGRLRAALASGEVVHGDLVVLALGVRPESHLAADAGLALGVRGHIAVNQYMQTSDPDIYAVGDAVQVTNPVTGLPTAVPLAGPANRQARIAADHISGLAIPYRGTMGTAIVKVFDLTAASAGANGKALTGEGIPFLATVTHSTDHVSYYPGATPQAIKLIYSPGGGRLLGAQVVGYNAVDRTIGVLATAISAGMTVFDLEHLELACAPPYGTAKDPVNIAGYVAGNRLRGDTDSIEWHEIRDLDPDRFGLLDVRAHAEWERGHIRGAVHIPQEALRERVGELARYKEWVVYCAVGRRAYLAERILKQHSLRARNLTGGWKTYEAAITEEGGAGDWLLSGAESLPTELRRRRELAPVG